MNRNRWHRAPLVPKRFSVEHAGALLVLAASSISACEAPSRRAADLRHCESPSPDIPHRYVLSQEWEVGGAADSLRALSPPLVYPMPAPDGGLSFAQRWEAPIITLNADGSVRSRIGAAGSGPGEWPPHSTGGVAWYGDTLWVVQMQPARLHAFSPDGTVLETRALDAEVPQPLTATYRLRNGAVVGSAAPRVPGGPRRLVQWRGPSGSLDSIGVAQVNFAYRVDLPGGGFAYGPRPVPDDLLSAAAPDGRSLVLVDRPTATDEKRAEFTIRKIGDDGRTLFERSVCYRPVPMAPADAADTIARQVERLVESFDGLPVAATEERVRDALQLPRFWPPVDHVMVGTGGEIWLRREQRDGRAAWEIRDAEGDLTGVLVLPAEETVMAVDGDVVWTQRLDEWDVPVIARSRLAPG